MSLKKMNKHGGVSKIFNLEPVYLIERSDNIPDTV